jgi:hypothetical protein
MGTGDRCDYDKEPGDTCPVTAEMEISIWTVYSTVFYFAMTTLTTGMSKRAPSQP